MSEFTQGPPVPTEHIPLEQPPDTDAELLARIHDGDEHAFAELWQRHEPYARALTVLTVGPYAHIDDAVQETAIKIWRKTQKDEQLQGTRRVDHYIGRTMTNACIDMIRKTKASNRPKEQLTDSFETLEDTNVISSATTVASAEDTAITNLVRHTLAAEINTLSWEHADILRAVYYGNESIGAYARRTGIPEGTAKSRVYYARKELAQRSVVRQLFETVTQ